MRLKKPLTFGVWRKRYKDRNANLHFKLKEDYKQFEHYSDKWHKAHPEKTILKKQIIKRMRFIDIETAANISEYGLKQEPCINFKQREECKLFRCLRCWLLIHPDDDILEYQEGFIHKLCRSK